MKKLFVILAVAAVTLVACKKEEVKYTESLGEISFQSINGLQTKAGSGPEISGTTFAEGNLLVVSATAEQKDNYFTGVTFKKDASAWKAYDFGAPAWAPVYWPAGKQRVDFLAYGLKDDDADASTLPAVATIMGVTPAFDATRPADMLTVTDWNVYEKQVDFVYAAANNKFNNGSADPVAMEFQHSTAMMIFNFKVSAGPAIKITAINFEKLVKQGTFVVDNTKTTLTTAWTPAAAVANTLFPGTAASAKSDYNATVSAATDLIGYNAAGNATWKQLNETFLVVPQERQSFTISYKIGADDTTVYTYKYDIKKGNWEAGKVYIYNIDFKLGEITIAPTVKDWTVAGMPEAIDML